jgi:hypothetical protein
LEAVVLYTVRVEIPDRRGSLARVAARIAHAGGDILGVEVLGTEAGRAVDEFSVELPERRVGALVDVLGTVGGVEVLAIRRSAAAPGTPLETQLLMQIAQQPHRTVRLFVDNAPALLAADWAMASAPDEWHYRSAGAPDDIAVPTEGRLPASRLRCASGAGEVHAALGVALLDAYVVVGREGGPDFHSVELLRLQHVVDAIVTVARAVGEREVSLVTAVT